MSCVRVTLECVNRHIIIAYTYTPNALRDAVELDAFNATSFSKSVMFHSPPFMCCTSVISQVFRMARLVRPLWNLAHDDFAPD